MRKFRIIALLLLAGCLTACVSSPNLIQSTPTNASLPLPITDPASILDWKTASSTLDQAVAIGALLPDDPAPACVHNVLLQAGIELAPGAVAPKSFVPLHNGPVSDAAVLYIQAQQAKQISSKGITVSVSCEAIVGRIFIDNLKAVAKVGTSLIPIPKF